MCLEPLKLLKQIELDAGVDDVDEEIADQENHDENKIANREEKIKELKNLIKNQLP